MPENHAPRPDGRRPTVSVVIPCYKYGHFLPGCVHSVLDQDGVDVRVLIIDDASPDDSAQVALRLAAEDPRVEAHVHEVNKGHIATYNEGLIDWADGDYSVLISADDFMTPGALARATAVMEENPAIGFAYGHAPWFKDDEPLPEPRTEVTDVKVWRGLDWLDIVCRRGSNVISSPEVVVRTSVQQAIGGYRADLPHTADAEMWMRFAVHADVAHLRGVDQAFYRIHQAQMSTSRVPHVDLVHRKAAYDAIFDVYADRIPGADRLRRFANRKMAREALWRACRAYERRRMDSTPIDELVGFAEGAYPRTSRLPEYWGLRWRRIVGPQACPYLQPLILSAVHKRIRTQLMWRRWARQGI